MQSIDTRSDAGARLSTYDNGYAPGNVYGHALTLLRRNVDVSATTTAGMIHLDIGCGVGRIAEPLTASLGVRYVGLDANEVGLTSLRARGFEAHQVVLGTFDDTLAALRAACDGRRLLSVTMLDVLEHLPTANEVLEAVRALIAEHQALVVISVPNVAHRDIGFKLAFGESACTETGLLDHTHTRLFNARGFRRQLEHCGLRSVDAFDVELTESDQHFPAAHPALADQSLLSRFLRHLRHGVDDTATTNQFVHACVAAPHTEPTYFLRHDPIARPFLSIVMRTQGIRIACLEEALTCLAAQSERDFELLVLGHALDEPRRIAVAQVLADQPAWLRSRTRLVPVDRGGRATPLNVGFSEAAGDYIAILDEDDLAFAHWVERFKRLSATHAGTILRVTPVLQTAERVSVDAHDASRNSGPIVRAYPSDFDFLSHLHRNGTPNNCVAFPRGVFHDLHIRFDEHLTTTEDWDFLLRTASVVGVTCDAAITTIYRWWEDGTHSSRSEHDTAEWHANRRWVDQKLDRVPLLLPAGAARRIRGLFEQHERAMGQVVNLSEVRAKLVSAKTELQAAKATRAAARARLSTLKAERLTLQRDLSAAKTRLAAARRTPAPAREASRAEAAARRGKLREIDALLRSSSWRVTAPLRIPGRLRGAPPITVGRCLGMGEQELDRVIAAIRSSTSWRLAAPIRRLRRLFRG